MVKNKNDNNNNNNNKSNQVSISSYFTASSSGNSSPPRTRRNSIDNGLDVQKELSSSPTTKSIARLLLNEGATKRKNQNESPSQAKKLKSCGPSKGVDQIVEFEIDESELDDDDIVDDEDEEYEEDSNEEDQLDNERQMEVENQLNIQEDQLNIQEDQLNIQEPPPNSKKKTDRKTPLRNDQALYPISNVVYSTIERGHKYYRCTMLGKDVMATMGVKAIGKSTRCETKSKRIYNRKYHLEHDSECLAAIHYRTKNNIQIPGDQIREKQLTIDSFLTIANKDSVQFMEYDDINKDNFRLYIAGFIIRNNLPIALCDDEIFQMFADKLGAKTVSNTTTTNDIEKLYKHFVNKIIEEFSKSKFPVSIILDLWTSPNSLPFIGIKVSYCIKELNANDVPVRLDFKTLLIAMVEFKEVHSGKNIANAIENVVKQFKLDGRVVSIAIDNAANGLHALKELSKSINVYGPVNFGVSRCCAHILHIGFVAFVKDKIKSINVSSLDIQQANLKDILNKMGEQLRQYSAAPHEVKETLNCFTDDEIQLESKFKSYHTFAVEFNKTQVQKSYDQMDAKTIKDLDDQCGKIKNLNRRLPSSHTARKIPIDVATRWGTFEAMVGTMLVLKPKIIQLLKLNKSKRIIPLTDEDWEDLSILHDLLHPLKEFQLKFSNHEYNISNSLPAILELIYIFEKKLPLNKYLRFKTNSKKLLGKFYKYLYEMQLNPLYFVAVILNPSNKLKFFDTYFFFKSKLTFYIQALESLYEKQYQQLYNQPPPTSSPSELEDDYSISIARDLEKQQQNEDNREYSIYTEINNYLKEPNCSIDSKVYWCSKYKEYPILYSIFCSFLTIPSSTVDIERTFSGAKLSITDKRHKLSGQRIEQLTLLREWSKERKAQFNYSISNQYKEIFDIKLG